MARTTHAEGARGEPPGGARFPSHLLYSAATQYYVDNVTQAEIGARLGVSRPTVSRLLSEARRLGIVEITVHPPQSEGDERLGQELSQVLGLERVYLVPAVTGPEVGRWLVPGVARALADTALGAGDVMLVSSGLTLYHCTQGDLPPVPGVVVAPTVGGQEEPEPWYQTNVIAHALADSLGGRPTYLYAPALPSASLHRSLLRDPSFLRIQELWGKARVALLGVGPAFGVRTVTPSFVPRRSPSLRKSVGDVCSRFFDSAGTELAFPGSQRLVAIPLDDLRRIPAAIAVAAGKEKAEAIIAGAAGGYFNRLVTDLPTAAAVLTATESRGAAELPHRRTDVPIS